MIADMDFETYSEAGYVWDETTQKWQGIGTAPYGLPAVGAAVYAEHPSTEVLCLAYDLKDGLGARLWLPTMPPPEDLFNHIRGGGLIEAHNSGFEWFIWSRVCGPRMGWPDLPLEQLRCSMSKSRSWSLPGKLANVAKVLNLVDQKDKEGTRLLNKFSKPRNPTKKDARKKLDPLTDPIDGGKLWAYNLQDIKVEAAVSAAVPALTDSELEIWLTDQKINTRGVHIDRAALDSCISIINQAGAKYTAELVQLTGGLVNTASEVANMRAWLWSRGTQIPNLQADTVRDFLTDPFGMPPDCRRVLEIRASLSASSVKKLFAMDRRLSSGDRLRDLFMYAGADRTSRWAGRGPQPQNLPAKGPAVNQCPTCNEYYSTKFDRCPTSGCDSRTLGTGVEWGHEVVNRALQLIATNNLALVEHYYGDAFAVVSGCLRGLFTPAPGADFICSDYSAIEAVVLAMIAGEQWRIDVFRTHGKIYEKSASMITGVPFEEFLEHKKRTGNHHPLRKKIGKYAELSLGYQGGLNALKAFGADEYLTDDELEKVKVDWRKASPKIASLWYGLQDAAIAAVQYPGSPYVYRGIRYQTDPLTDVLYCTLPSGRHLAYHAPRITTGPYGRPQLTYMGSDSKTYQWVRIETYGGKLTENVVQATARDILAHALVNLEKAGYPVVLHVHDEAVGEVAEGTGSVAEFEAIMNDLPAWCADWPIKATGGWRDKRFRKD